MAKRIGRRIYLTGDIDLADALDENILAANKTKLRSDSLTGRLWRLRQITPARLTEGNMAQQSRFLASHNICFATLG